MEYRFHEKITRQAIGRICPVSVSRLIFFSCFYLAFTLN